MPESELVAALVSILQSTSSPIDALSVAREFDYRRGRADVISVTSTGMLLAFEAKCSRWRVALHQAHRNRCFVDASYVVLPEATAHRAHAHWREFDRLGVGLAYVHGGVLTVLAPAAYAAPIQPWLRQRAIDELRG